MSVVSACGYLRAFVERLRGARLAVRSPAPADDPALLSLTLGLAAIDDWLLRSGRDAPLQVAVIGPTQAGKSTMVNLLLGAEKSEASPLAAFTDRLHGFVQGVDVRDQGWVLEVIDEPSASLEFVAAPPGFPCIVWDTPDFDSHRSGEYRPAIAKAAALADVVLLVVSKEKYSDLSVWRTLGVLKPLGRRLVVCLNKVSVDEAVLVSAVRSRLQESGWGDVVPIIPFPYVQQENAFESLAVGAAAVKLNGAVLRADNARDGAARLRGVQALLRVCWSDWTGPVRAEIAATESWSAAVDEEIRAALARYRSQYLDRGVHYDAFKQTLLQLLVLLEVPAIARPLARVRSVLTWPVKKVASVFAGEREQRRDVPETQVLEDVVDHALLSLHRLIVRTDAESTQARLWWNTLGRVYGAESDNLRRRFSTAAARYRAGFEVEIDEAAHALYARLRENPVALNALRATRLGADAAAVVIAVKTGTIGVADALLTPAMLSLTSALTEGAVGRHVNAVRDDLKHRQYEQVEALLRHDVHDPLLEMAAALPEEALLGIGRERLDRLERALAEVLA